MQISIAWADANVVSKAPGETVNHSFTCSKILPSALIKSGDFFEGSTWNDPSVLWDKGRYVMYASSDHHFDTHIEIYRLVSSDGKQWMLSPGFPVLSPSEDGWDRKSVETPSVVFFKGRYYLFYTGYAKRQSDVRDYKIGYAVSDDGIRWTRMTQPLVRPTQPYAWFPSMDFRQYIVSEPAALVMNDRLYVYFTALGGDKEVNTTLQTIGLIVSEDGKSWSAPKMILRPDQKFYSRENNIKGFSTPAALAADGKVHLFFDVVTDEPFSQIALSHAFSENGVDGWVQESTPFLTKSDLIWTGNQIRSPSAMIKRDGSVLLWFAGDDGVDFLGIGQALCHF
ncbi:MAG: hypothetical protein RBR86_05355 [Pseudobdellovibrionaceae bacterium]|jgi:predicted GH43/DUF377 family glycosyl hydrolase|nr:hypothetical protein [Pseudobdellovibrionaceae bacterium]